MAAGRCHRGLPVVLLSMLAACASGPRFPAPLPATLPEEIAEVPFHPQEALQCGPAALATVLGWSGVNTQPQELEPYLFMPQRGGTLQPEIKAQARRLGRIPYELPAQPAALPQELAAGHPVLVLQNNGLGWLPAWHYAVVVGMDTGRERLRLRSGAIRDHWIRQTTFLRTWRRADYWGLVVLPPGKMPASVPPSQVLAAINDFARLAEPDAVAAALGSAVSRWPEDTGLRFALANHHYSRGDHEAAEREYRKLLHLAPDAVMARNNLAWLRAEQGDAAGALQLLAHVNPESEGPWRDALRSTWKFADCRKAGMETAACEMIATAQD